MAKKYKYVGNGLGVSGLPHEITDEQAKKRKVYDLLQSAIAAGLYKEEKEKTSRAEKTAPDGDDPAERDIKE